MIKTQMDFRLSFSLISLPRASNWSEGVSAEGLWMHFSWYVSHARNSQALLAGYNSTEDAWLLHCPTFFAVSSRSHFPQEIFFSSLNQLILFVLGRGELSDPSFSLTQLSGDLVEMIVIVVIISKAAPRPRPSNDPAAVGDHHPNFYSSCSLEWPDWNACCRWSSL